MFNNQQQLQQLIQLQHLLQQQQHTVQQPAHHPQSAPHALPAQHAAPRALPNPVQHQQPQQMLNLRAANPARLLNTHPMIQRALLMQQMQGNLRGLSMVAPPPMPPFFTAAARHSILGIPPMGVTVKAPSMTFPHMPFQQPRVYHKDHYKNTDVKRDGDQGSSAPGKYANAPNAERGNAELPPTASEADESLNSDTENLTECSNTDPLEPSAKRARSSETATDERGFAAEGSAADAGDVAEERSVQSQSAEGVSGGRALKVTIQVRSESRTTALQPARAHPSGPRFCCYICKSSYHSLQNFQSHLVTAQHQQKIQDIQHVSNACLVTLLPTAKDDPGGTAGTDRKKQMRWCNVCQVHFCCDLIKHRRTQEHKMAKRSLRPFCTVCSRHFKTPRKFVEHMKSPEHKQKSQELREKETWSPEESEELITVDAVGCFEEDDDDCDDDDEEGISADDVSEDTECPRDELKDNVSDHEEYKADTAYGLDYMVPVAGYLCRLCHKFYPSDSAARLAHCKSLVHFQNVQRSKAEKKSRSAIPSEPEDDSGNQGRVTTTDLTDEGCSIPPLQDGGGKAKGPPGAGVGGTSVSGKCGDVEDSVSAFDTVIGTSEEDSSFLLEQEMFLDQKEEDEEEETLYSDDAPSTRRPTSLHRVR